MRRAVAPAMLAVLLFACTAKPNAPSSYPAASDAGRQRSFCSIEKSADAVPVLPIMQPPLDPVRPDEFSNLSPGIAQSDRGTDRNAEMICYVPAGEPVPPPRTNLPFDAAPVLPAPWSPPVEKPVLGEEILPEVGEDVEMTLFDLYVADKSVGYILLRYTEHVFVIENPQDVLEQLPKLVNSTGIVEALSGVRPLSYAVPRVLSARCDLNTFRLILEIDPSKLEAREISTTDRIPDPERSLSFMQELRGAAASGIDTDANASLGHRSVLSFGKLWSTFDGTWVKGEDYEVDDASATAILGDYRLDAGLMQTEGSSFAGTVQFAGATLRSAEKVLANQEVLRGSRLEIFVPSRAHVSFYRGERLLATRIYNFGLHEVDTSSFPTGSYLVDVVIEEENGETTREQRLFTKSGQLAVRGRPEFLLQGGAVRDELELDDTYVFQSKVAYRLLSAMQVEGGLAGDEQVLIGTAGALGLWRDFLYGTQLGYSDQDNLGYQVQGSGKVLGLNFSASYLKNVVRNTLETLPIADDEEISPFVRQEDNFNLLAEKRSVLNAAVSYFPLDDVEVRYSAVKNQNPLRRERIDLEDLRESVSNRYTYGPSLIWRIIGGAVQQLQLQLSLFETDEGTKSMALLAYRYREPRSLWTHESSLRAGEEDRGSNAAALASQQYSTKTQEQFGTEVDFEGEVQKLPNEDSPVAVAGVEADHKNNFMSVGGFVRTSDVEDGINTTSGVNLASAAIVDGDGDVSVVAPATSSAFVLVDLQSKSSTTSMNVILDGTVKERLVPGTKLLIGVLPYQVHRVAIQPGERSELVDYEAEDHVFVAFPGNVIKKTWQIEKIFIALGRVVDENGAPLGLKRIRGAKGYAVTERDGTFQAEVSGREDLFIETPDEKCSLDLTPPTAVEYFAEFGDVVCRAAN